MDSGDLTGADRGQHVRFGVHDEGRGGHAAAVDPAAAAVQLDRPHAVLPGVENHAGDTFGQDASGQRTAQAADEQRVQVGQPTRDIPARDTDAQTLGVHGRPHLRL